MTAPEVLVIGEALIDIVRREDGHREYVGGSPANLAIGTARLGHRTQLLTHIARDERGERIARHVRDEGVDLHEGSWSARRTSTADAEIGPDGSATYRFDLSWELPRGLDTAASVVHTGSIALFVEPGGAAVLDLLASLPASTLVTLDPNVRPSLLPDHADALTRFEAAASRCDLVKLSDEDVVWLYPGRTLEQVLAHIRALGPAIVVITRGADGAVGDAGAGAVGVRAYAGGVVDTISAGDSFMASLVSSLLELGPDAMASRLPGALDRAARAAAIAVSVAGANPPTRAALDAYAGERPFQASATEESAQ